MSWPSAREPAPFLPAERRAPVGRRNQFHHIPDKCVFIWGCPAEAAPLDWRGVKPANTFQRLRLKSHPTSRRPSELVGGWRRELTWRSGSAVTRCSTRRRTDGATYSFSSSRGNEDVSQQEVRRAAAPPASRKESSG